MNCDQIKEKMNECLKNDSDNRECKEIVDSWKLECEQSSWFGNVFSKSDKTDDKEDEKESEESPKNVLKEESEEVSEEDIDEKVTSIINNLNDK